MTNSCQSRVRVLVVRYNARTSRAPTKTRETHRCLACSCVNLDEKSCSSTRCRRRFRSRFLSDHSFHADNLVRTVSGLVAKRKPADFSASWSAEVAKRHHDRMHADSSASVSVFPARREKVSIHDAGGSLDSRRESASEAAEESRQTAWRRCRCPRNHCGPM